MAYNNSERPASRRPARRRRKVCVFCGGEEISYKDAAKLKKYVSERGKILPRRVTGTCAKHQRALKKVLEQDPRPSYQNSEERVYGLSFAGMEIKFQVKDEVLHVVGVEM